MSNTGILYRKALKRGRVRLQEKLSQRGPSVMQLVMTKKLQLLGFA